jgi:hypothetical protein
VTSLAAEPVDEPVVQSLRYRGAMRLAYSVALLLLMEHAWQSKAMFEFGPMDLDSLENQGLTISGPDLVGVQAVLEGIPGLFLSED